MNSIFELIMLVCFGVSWPFSVYKSWKSRSTQGKSLIFLLAIWVGYISGILHKVFFSWDYVILAYIFNLCMVSLDLYLYMVNRRREKRLSVPPAPAVLPFHLHKNDRFD